MKLKRINKIKCDLGNQQWTSEEGRPLFFIRWKRVYIE